jgi:hypothetical protein
MTKQDFILIATVLHRNKPSTADRLHPLWQAMVCDFADELQATNERFNKQHFIQACHTGQMHPKRRTQ